MTLGTPRSPSFAEKRDANPRFAIKSEIAVVDGGYEQGYVVAEIAATEFAGRFEDTTFGFVRRCAGRAGSKSDALVAKLDRWRARSRYPSLPRSKMVDAGGYAGGAEAVVYVYDGYVGGAAV